MRRVSDLIKIDDIRNWTKGNIITIKAGTGAGKSYFIKNILYAFAKANNKKILMLIHRKNCVDQFQAEIVSDNKQDVIDIKTYQFIESAVKKHKGYNLDAYDYIVSDEFHYFMSDASFSKTTDISLETILKYKGATRIFMSATDKTMKTYIKNIKKLNVIEYELETDNSIVQSLTFFNKDKTIEKFIEEGIEKRDKAILFIQSAKKAYELHKKYKDYSLFNCSASNEEYYKFVDKNKINNLLENTKFDEQFLITTTCMDAGVNIIDEDVKHIVCDVEDINTLVQCCGRKRQQNKEDKVNIYIKNINNKKLGGFITQRKQKTVMADFFKSHTVKEFVAEYTREFDYSNMIYDLEVTEDDKCTKRLNELMYYKCKSDLVLFQSLTKSKFGYMNHIKNLFGIERYRLIKENQSEENNLINYLDKKVGEVMLQVKDRKELIETLEVKSNGKLLKKINNLNGALEEMELSYRIIEFSTSKIIEGKQKKYPNAWRIEKLISE